MALVDGHGALGVQPQREVDPRLPGGRRGVLVHGARLLRHTGKCLIVYVVVVKNLIIFMLSNILLYY